MMNTEDVILPEQCPLQSLQRVDNQDVFDVVVEEEEEEEESLEELIKRYNSYKSIHQHDKDDVDETDSDDNDEEKHISKPFVKLKQPQLEAPEFIERLRGFNEASAGTSISFVAQFKAFPVPTVKWFKDEEEVCHSERYQLSFETEGTLRLTINDVTTADEGAYKCKVENQEGVASTTGYLSVIGTDMRSRRKARTTSSRSNRTTPSPSRSRSPAVSLPPALRSITEHRSIEESEEEELYRQPPSPLQSFIDNIRHCANSRHPPIFYGTDDLLFRVGPEEEEEDVFETFTSSSGDLERQATLTGDDGDVPIIDTPSTLTNDSSQCVEPRTVNVQNDLVVSTFISFSSNLFESVHAEAISANAGALLSTSQDHVALDNVPYCTPVTITTSTNVPHSRTTISSMSLPQPVGHHSPSNFRQRRLGRLQHRLAIDIPPDHSSSTISSCEPVHSKSESNGNDSSFVNRCRCSETELKIACDLTDVFLRVFFATIDSQVIQLYAVLVTVATVLANTFAMPPSCVILVVAASSLVSFQFFEQHRIFSRVSHVSQIEPTTFIHP